MYYFYFVFYFVVLAFSSPKLFQVFDVQTRDLLNVVASLLFGVYFLFRMLTQYRGNKAARRDLIFIIAVCFCVLILAV